MNANRRKQINIGTMSAYELIDYLDKRHPPRPPKLNTPEPHIWFDAGKRDLIETLLTTMKKEQNG